MQTRETFFSAFNGSSTDDPFDLDIRVFIRATMMPAVASEPPCGASGSCRYTVSELCPDAPCTLYIHSCVNEKPGENPPIIWTDPNGPHPGPPQPQPDPFVPYIP